MVVETTRTIVDGRLASPDDGWNPAVTTYGHFTAMQVRDRRTRGFDLHLDRLRRATNELFGRELDHELVRRSIQLSLGDDIEDASVRIYVVHTDREPSVIATAKAPVEPPACERLKSVLYQRPLAHLKHLGGFRIGGLDAQTYFRQRVQAEGFDEALLTAADGSIAEAAIANIGFLTGEEIVWPNAPALPGITMQVVQRALSRDGRAWGSAEIRLGDLDAFHGAFLTNSHGIWPVTVIDERQFEIDGPWFASLAAAYDSIEWDEI